MSLGYRGRIRTQAHLVPKPTDGFPGDGCDNMEGSRRDPSATPGKTSKLGSPKAGVALFMDSLPELAVNTGEFGS